MNNLIEKCFKPIRPVEDILQKEWNLVNETLPNESGIYFVMKRRKRLDMYEYACAVLKFDVVSKMFIERRLVDEPPFENYAWKSYGN